MSYDMVKLTFRSVPLHLCKEDYDQLHNTKDMELINEHGIVVYRMSEATSNQQWYREVIRAGIRSKLREFEDMKKRIECRE